MTQAQAKEIIGVGVSGEIPVEGLLEVVKVRASQLCPQPCGECALVLLCLPELGKLIAEGVDLFGKIGIIQEQCGENVIHRKQPLYMSLLLV